MEKDFDFNVRIYYEDTDTAGVVYYANYLRYFERARAELLRKLGYSQTELMETESIGFVVRKATEEFLRTAKLDDLITIKTSLLEVKKASFVLSQDVMRDDEVLVKSEITMVAISPDSSGKFSPTKLPSELYEKLRFLKK